MRIRKCAPLIFALLASVCLAQNAKTTVNIHLFDQNGGRIKRATFTIRSNGKVIVAKSLEGETISFEVPQHQPLEIDIIAERQFSLAASIENIFNHANLTNNVGLESSPFFMKPTVARSGRTLEFSLTYSF